MKKELDLYYYDVFTNDKKKIEKGTWSLLVWRISKSRVQEFEKYF